MEDGLLLKDQYHEQILAFRKGKERSEELDLQCKFIRAGIPNEYWGLEIECMIGNKIASKYVRQYLGKLDTALDNGLGFVFMGPNGTGKTSFQMFILKQAIINGYSAFYMPIYDIFHRIYLGFDYKPVLIELHKTLRTAQFLGIGEIGKEYSRRGSEQFVISEFDSIFRNRRGTCLPTSMDTNMTEDEMGDTYGSSLMSLFRSRNKFLKLKGNDFRLWQQMEWDELIKG